jgi:hypothetical protein
MYDRYARQRYQLRAKSFNQLDHMDLLFFGGNKLFRSATAMQPKRSSTVNGVFTPCQYPQRAECHKRGLVIITRSFYVLIGPIHQLELIMQTRSSLRRY